MKEIYDPPEMLLVKGRLHAELRLPLAVIGTRSCTAYGKGVAAQFGEALANAGACVISGLAYGLDTEAARGALSTASAYPTVAVLGCGIDEAYPREHAGLLRRICSSGCVVSEYPPGEAPLPWRFPHRNRIIAGLSHAVVVVEASEKSGALITADMALEEGREVMAVPGPIGSSLSRGTNRLIQKGAKLVLEVEDICEELPFLCLQPPGGQDGRGRGGNAEPSESERACVELLRGEARGLDWLAAHSGRTPGDLLACLSAMALKGWVAEEAGGRYRLLLDPVVP